jgi:hypothetical protein
MVRWEQDEKKRGGGIPIAANIEAYFTYNITGGLIIVTGGKNISCLGLLKKRVTLVSKTTRSNPHWLYTRSTLGGYHWRAGPGRGRGYAISHTW